MYDEGGSHLLNLAIAHGTAAAVAKLLQHGANPNAPDRRQQLPLVLAAQLGRGDVIRALLAHGAQPDGVDPGGRTALTAAALTGQLGSIAELAGHPSCSLDAADARGYTPLCVAAMQVRHPGLGQPMDAGQLRGRCRPWMPASFSAGTGHDAGQLRGRWGAANAAGARISCRTTAHPRQQPGSAPPACAPPAQGNLALVEQLLARGADVDSTDLLGNTAAIWAACTNHVDLLRLLLAAGADPNRTAYRGSTALLQAAGEGHLEAVQLLLAVPGIDVAAADADGVAPLLEVCCCQRGDPGAWAEVAAQLLAAGAPAAALRSSARLCGPVVAALLQRLAEAERQLAEHTTMPGRLQEAILLLAGTVSPAPPPAAQAAPGTGRGGRRGRPRRWAWLAVGALLGHCVTRLGRGRRRP
jgi:ankyrin repeat protein